MPVPGSSSTQTTALPRLACIGDVNVQNYCHGSLQLFRLLESYPPEKLSIVETTWQSSMADRRLPRVAYHHLRPWWSRLFHQSRFPQLSPWLAQWAVRRWSSLLPQLGPFQPEALLAVAHGFSWLAVSELAHRRGLPLHLIVHDDWPRHPHFSPRVSAQLAEVFRHHYRRAASRLCVSASMEEAYRKAYGVAGEVLYPTRSADLVVAAAPPERLGHVGGSLTVAFAGTLHPGQVAPLRLMVDALRQIQGRLLIFGPMSEGELRSADLLEPPVEFRGMRTANDLLEEVRREAHLLYTPLPFSEAWRGNASMGFPSKLTDYTAAGLPILIHGPPWSAAVKWALQEPASFLVLESMDRDVLVQELSALHADAALRLRLGRAALEIGARCFGIEPARRIFHQSLTSSPRPFVSA